MPVGGSTFTRHAVNYLIRHLRMFGAKPQVHLVHVMVPIPGRAAVALGCDVDLWIS